jgi:hypothetical protein
VILIKLLAYSLLKNSSKKKEFFSERSYLSTGSNQDFRIRATKIGEGWVSLGEGPK